MRALVDRQIDAEIAADRLEARRNARLRCRARELMEAAKSALASSAIADDVNAGGLASKRTLTLRAMSPLELGLMYEWMAKDEATGKAPRWWGGGAVGIQASWEAASGWFDEALEEAGSSSGSVASAARRKPAEESVAALVASLESGAGATAVKSLGAAAARAASTPPLRGPHVLGAFVAGQSAPLGFVATKDPVGIRRGGGGSDASRVRAADWTIDAMGTRLSCRGRGVGTALALHCIEAAARCGDADECRLDVIPTAVTFWQRLGFEEVPATGEQAYLMQKGGDRPMVKRFDRSSASGGVGRAPEAART